MVRHLILSLFAAATIQSTANASPCRPNGPTDYCNVPVWKQDALIASFSASVELAQEICTAALQPVRTVTDEKLHVSGSAPASQVVTTVVVTVTDADDYIVTQTEDHGHAPGTHDVYSTVIVEGPEQTVTKVIQNGQTTIITAETVQRTVDTTTKVFPTSTKTVETTLTHNNGSTAVKTVTLDVQTQTSMVYTATTAVATNTLTDIRNNTLTSVETAFTTSTDLVVTGTVVKIAPGATLVVTKSRTFLIYATVATNTHVAYTSTDLITSTYTTVTRNTTATSTTVLPRTTVSVTTFNHTLTHLTTTSTETVPSTSIVPTNEWTTDYETVYTNTATDVQTVYTQHAFPWWQLRKRSFSIGAYLDEDINESVPEDRWVSQYGEAHVKSACSCIVTSPLPTRTTTGTIVSYPTAGQGSTETVTSTVRIISTEASTETRGINDTAIVTSIHPTTVTTAKTVTDTLTLNGTTVLDMPTVTVDITRTVFSTPVTEITLTKHTTTTGVREVTTEISGTDLITLYGVKTGYTWVEITKTEDIWEYQTKFIGVGKTIEVAATTTSFFTSTVETEVFETSTVLVTANHTVGGVFTHIEPVAVTDTNTFVYTATVFTDATTTYSLEATSTIGVVAKTTAVTVLTVNNGVTSTITSVIETDSTVTAYAVATQTCAIPIADGDMNMVPDKVAAPIPLWNAPSKWKWPLGVSPWHESYYSEYSIFKESLKNDAQHKWVLGTDYLYNNREARIYQDATTCAGVRFRCTYEFYFDKYYSVQYIGDDTWWVPYFRILWNDEVVGERWPMSAADVGRWMSGSIEFTATGGEDTLWIRAASPQEPKKGKDPNRGDNFIRWDNFQCRPIQYNG